MSFEVWAAFCITETALCFTPGPAVLLVVSVALGQGLWPGLGASLGILTANTLYFGLSATGVAVALAASHEMFLLLKWIGAAYIIWLGLHMMLSRRSRGIGARPIGVTGPFFRGFVVQGANPKALVFFMALLPQFINPAAPVAGQVFILGVSSVVIEFVALAVYAHGAARARRVAGARVAGALERVGGALLVAVGARLAVIQSE